MNDRDAIDIVRQAFQARLPEQFEAILHIDKALEPLELWSRDETDLPETYPSALWRMDRLAVT